MTSSEQHWNAVYAGRPLETVSWFQARNSTSTRLIDRAAAGRPGPSIVDVGAGGSTLVDDLLDAGHTEVTVLDISPEALAGVSGRLGDRADAVTLVVADLLTWQPARAFDVWHDRAVLHFLDPDDVTTYVALAGGGVATGGALVLGVFAADGPTTCSGLPTTGYSADDLAALFAPTFHLEHHEREEHRTPGGASQAFTWVVLRHR